MSYRCSRGISLIELITVLSVMAIVLSLAIPAFGGMLQRTRQGIAIQQLRETVNFARMAAITNNGGVSLCHAPTGYCDTSTIWSSSTRVFRDDDRDGIQSEQEATLLTSYLPEGLHWRWSNFRAQTYLTFLGSGMTDALNGSFILCRGSEPKARLVLNKAGRIDIATLRTSDSCA